MFKKIPLLLAFLIITVQLSCKSEAKKTDERTAVVDSTINAFQTKYYSAALDSIFARQNFNGSIAVFKNGKTVYSRQSGFRDFENKIRLDSNSVFAIGSLSKQFTAVMILLQQEAGKLKIDDPAGKYISELSGKQFEDVTVRHLLTHTSGIGDFGPNLQSAPGEKFSYSNKGYRLLGKIIEKVSGKSFAANSKELFQKAGMSSTFTPQDFSAADFASAYLGNKSRQQKIENMPLRLAADEISVPAGGLLSTVRDLDRWNEALFAGKIINGESLKILKHKVSQRKHYVLGTVGYGAGIMMNLNAPEAYFHSGYVKGSPSLNIYYPASGTSVVILSNIADESKGKEGFFQPHADVKNITDAVENTVNTVRTEMKTISVPDSKSKN